MALPPESPSNWQTKYTKNKEFRNATMHTVSFILPILFLFLFVVVYAAIHPKLFNSLKSYFPILLWEPPDFLIILVSFFVFAIAPAFSFASRFLTEFYQPPKGIRSYQVINYRLFGKSKLPVPLNILSQFENILVKDGEILNKDRWPAWSACTLGGPISLIVFDGCALYLERENRFSRVVGPGDITPFLEWYETIKYVVDLRPKVKVDSFDVWTKDGIKVKFTIQIECRIGDPAKHNPASRLMYPFDPMAVKKAIERYALRWPNRIDGEPSEFTWIDAAWGQVTGIVPGYVGSRMLDDLFIADRNSGQILSPDAIKEIIKRLNSASNGFGVFITDFQISRIEIPKEVEEFRKRLWMAERQSIATLIDGQAKAFNIRTQEKARADALRDRILALVDGLNKNEDASYNEAILQSLSKILDEELNDS